MAHVLRDIVGSLRASPIFGFYVMATLAVAGIIGLITFDVINLGMAHFGEANHRIHDVTYGLLFTTGVSGLLAQLRQPENNVAAMLMALVPAAALVLAAGMSGNVDAVVRSNPLRYAAAVTAVAALLHPTGRDFFASFSVSRVSWVMVGLVGVATVPLLGLASTNLRLQETVTDSHRFMGHYGFMAAFSFAVMAVGVTASLRPDGWRRTAWVTGLLPALLGVTSLLYPNASSSIGLGWSLTAISWGVVFVAAAVMAGDAPSPQALGARAAPSMSEPLAEGQATS
ncbi:MAG: hypothetical protein M3N28_10555 [Actinomycetota bacterium]|nr:hypothetical protein [Actinomycetota bacterium]